MGGIACCAIVCVPVSSAHPTNEIVLFNALTDNQCWIDCGEMQICHERYPIEKGMEFHTDLFAPIRWRFRNGGECSGEERCHRVIRRSRNTKIMSAPKPYVVVCTSKMNHKPL